MDYDATDHSGERIPDADLPIVWREYCADRHGRLDLRDRLVGHYFPYVRDMAERMIRSLSSCVDVQDIISAGSLGLLDAVTRYEPDRNILFETFSRNRIRGAIIDDFRRNDFVPRPVRQASNRIAKIRAELESYLGCPPSDEEMAGAMEMEVADFRKLQHDSQVHSFVPLERNANGDENGKRELDPIEMVADVRAVEPLEKLIREEVKNQALRGLSEAERKVLILLYDRELNLNEIGKILDLSESRVCQIKNKAIAFLRNKHQEIKEELTQVLG